MKVRSKAVRSDRNRQAIAGVRKHFASTATVVIDGVPHTPDDIVRALQSSIDASDATAAAGAQFHKTVEAEKAANASADAMYGGLKTLVTSQFKTTPDTMADFGITLPSRQVPDAATAAAAAEKRRATRVARHTMGKRQKANVKGTVTTPETAPAPTPITPPAK
jgi:hypothetical protein